MNKQRREETRRDERVGHREALTTRQHQETGGQNKWSQASETEKRAAIIIRRQIQIQGRKKWMRH